MKKLLLLLAPLVLILFSCVKEKLPNYSAARIQVSKTSISGEASAFSDTIAIQTGRDWTISKPDSVEWLSFSPKSGSGNENIIIDVEENTSAGQREVKLTLESGRFTQKIRVVQAGKHSLSLSRTEIDTSYMAFKDSFEIITINDWTITDVPDWISLSEKEGSGITKVMVDATENDSQTPRSATMKVVTSYASKTIKVIQKGIDLHIDTTAAMTIDTAGHFLDLSDGGKGDLMYLQGEDPLELPAEQSFSISLKMKDLPGAGTTQPRVLYWSNGTAYIGLVIDRNAQDGQLGWFLVDKEGTALREGPLGGSGSAAQNVTTTSVKDGKWHHVVLVYNAEEEESYIYLDGQKEGVVEENASFAGLNMKENFFVGDFTKEDANWNFGGYIDDLHFWNKALNKEEVYADAADIEVPTDKNHLIAGWDFEKQDGDLFHGLTGNYEGVLINGAKQGEPTAPNPYNLLVHKTLFENADEDHYRCPGLAVAANGDLLLVADKRVGSNSDVGGNSNISLVIKRSTDNGESWSDMEPIGGAPDGGVSDPAIVVDGQTGDIFVFGSYVGDQGDHLLYMYKSTDNGKSWTGPVDKTDDILDGKWNNGFKFIASGHGLYTREGKLMFVLNHVGEGDYLVYSDDHGSSWNMKDELLAGGDEAKVVELNNGSLMVNARDYSHGGGRRIFRSTDGGASWDFNYDDNLIDPACNAGIVAYTQKKDGFTTNRLLFSNCASSSRSMMTVKLSYDGGQTWKYAEQMSQYGAYSTITVLNDGTIALAFETNHGKIIFDRFDLKYLTRGEDQLDVDF